MDTKFELNLTVGNDNGNSEHDLIINGDFIAQPNVFSKVTALPNLEDINVSSAIKNLEDELIVQVVTSSKGIDAGYYYVGKSAYSTGEPVTSLNVGYNDSKHKLESPIPVINTISQIACYATKKAYEHNKNLDVPIVVHADMCTALPVKYFDKENASRFSNRFKGNHSVIVYVGELKARVEIIFDVVVTMPEGVTAIFALSSYATNNKEFFTDFCKKYNCTITDNYFKNKNIRVAHIAIGDGTTEYPITAGRNYLPNHTTGSNNGMGHAIENSLPSFKEKVVNIKRYSRQQYSNALIDADNKYHDDAISYIKSYVIEQADEIAKTADKVIEAAQNEVDIVCAYGGGSIGMKEYLEPQLYNICEKRRTKLLYVPSEYAIKLEVTGLYEFTQLPSFTKLKNEVN